MSRFYGTLFGRNDKDQRNRERFHREIDRFKADPRFSQFYVFVECDLMTWLNYLPPNNSGNDLMINQKIAALASLHVRGASVVWCGSRMMAVKMYRDFVRQYCLKSYRTIIRGSGRLEGDVMGQPRVCDEVRI